MLAQQKEEAAKAAEQKLQSQEEKEEAELTKLFNEQSQTHQMSLVQ